MEKPLVSILIASYNKEKFVKRCIKSCLNQSYKNIEIIFVDDQSSDKSFKIASQFKKVKVFKKKRLISNNKFNTFYQSDTYVFGLKKSKGRLITLLDSDDFYKKNKIENIVRYFRKMQNKHIVFDKPILYFKNNKSLVLNEFHKRGYKIWPKFPPTSCISLKKKIFYKFIKELKLKKFHLLTIDFRLAVISNIILNDFYILNKHLTYYYQDETGESNYFFKKFNKNWWNRRKQAHEYIKYIYKKYKNTNYQKNLDYLITNIINKIIN